MLDRQRDRAELERHPQLVEVARHPFGQIDVARVEPAGRQHEGRLAPELGRHQQLAGEVELDEPLDADERVAQAGPDEQEPGVAVVVADDVDQQLQDRRHAGVARRQLHEHLADQDDLRQRRRARADSALRTSKISPSRTKTIGGWEKLSSSIGPMSRLPSATGNSVR